MFFYVCCSDCVGLWECLLCNRHYKVKYSVFSLRVVMLCVSVGGMMDVVFSVSTAGAHVSEVFCHGYVLCLSACYGGH